jgi:hypothetical protein
LVLPAEVLTLSGFCAIALISLSAATATAGATTSAKSQSALLSETLATLNRSSPISDLNVTWGHSDFRFVGVNSYTCMAPGVGGIDTELPQRYGLRCLFGTSDFIESRKHAALLIAASRYAASYNAELVRRIHRNR